MIKPGNPQSIEGKHSPELRAKILASYKSGLSVDDVARRYDVKPYTVRKLARQAGILRLRGGRPARSSNAARDARRAKKIATFGHQHARVLTQDQRLAVVKAYQAGTPVAQIEKDYGVSGWSIRSWAKKLGGGVRTRVKTNLRGRNSARTHELATKTLSRRLDKQFVAAQSDNPFVQQINDQLDQLVVDLIVSRIVFVAERLRRTD